MKRLNWKIVHSNVREARQQLLELERRMESGRRPTEEDLQSMHAHATHHINFAWNIRRVSTERYRSLSNSEFRRWGRHPKGLENS